MRPVEDFETAVIVRPFVILLLLVLQPGAVCCAAQPELRAELAWRYRAGSGACEIACYAPAAEQLFVTVGTGVDIVDARSGQYDGKLDRPDGYRPTSVAHSNGRLAVAWAAEDKAERGLIALFAVETGKSPRELRTFDAGYLPDMLVFSPDGRYLVVANEGEPSKDYSVDPVGSVTVIDLKDGPDKAIVSEATFEKYDAQRDELRARGVRVFGPSKSHDDGATTVAEDLEPEYIAVSPDSKRAWIALQENNALAEMDLGAGRVEAIHPLGAMDFRRSAAGANGLSLTGLDASDDDGGARIRHWPVRGLYQPDGIAIVSHNGTQYLLTVNEGDPRRYKGFKENCAAGELADKGIALDERLKARLLLADDQLGRLEVSTASGDADGDGDLDALHAFGTRSFSVWRLAGRRPPVQVFDSGHEFEWVTAREAADRYNADSSPRGVPDEQSPKRGPEPESLAVGKVGERTVAAIGLEKTGGAMLYDVTDPTSPLFLNYLPALNADGILDRAPEGLLMISADANPLGKALLVLCHEKSGTMTAYALEF